MKAKQPLYDPATGIHRAKVWEIAFYALNNTSTNCYMLITMYITYFLMGPIGVAAVLAGSLATILRIWDGVTDPVIGFIVDKTNGKFGKNRPFILIGQVIMISAFAILFNFVPNAPAALRLPLYIVFYAIWVLGYTCQCVVTKSAQTCLTNDPKQRPIFSIFDSIFNMAVFAIIPMYITGVLVPKYNVVDEAGNILTSAFYVKEFHQALFVLGATLSVVFAIFAIIGLWRKDRPEFFGTGKAQMVKFSDYFEVLKKNRAIQMLCVACCSDKLSMTVAQNATVMAVLFGVIIGDYSQYTAFTGISSILGIIIPMVLVLVIARNFGQKQSLMIATYGGIITAIAVFFMLWLGDPTQINFTNMNGYTVLFLLVFCLMKGMGGFSSTIVIPMTADCADYEVYRSGRYVPGLMGTLFSFIDKVTSSLGTTIIALLYAAIGFKEQLPDQTTAYSESIFWITMFCLIGLPLIGLLLNIVAMKYYPLTKEKMESIQEEIARIKAEASAE